MPRRTLLGSGILLFILLQFTVYGQSNGPSVVDILTITVNRDGDTKSVFHDFITDSVLIELERLGFTVTSGGGQEEVNDLSWEDRENIEILMYSLAEEEDAYYSLIILYARADGVMQFQFRLYDVQGRELVDETDIEGSVDLSMDTYIAEGVRDLIDRADVKPQERAALITEEETDQEDVADEESEQPPGLPDSEPPAEEREDRSLFTFSIGFAPFLTTGDASKYFTVGIQPQFHLGFRLKGKAGFISLGLFGLLNSFSAKGEVVATDNFIIAAGPDIRFTLEAGDMLGLFFQAAGGPSIFAVNSEQTGALTKIIPFALAGIGVSVDFSKTFGLALIANYEIFFEGTLFIMGFSPSLNAHIRL